MFLDVPLSAADFTVFTAERFLATQLFVRCAETSFSAEKFETKGFFLWTLPNRYASEQREITYCPSLRQCYSMLTVGFQASFVYQSL